MKIGALFKDKRVLYGTAAAGVLGLVVFMRRGAGDVSAGGDEQGGGQPIQPAQFDSTGTDVYNAIQSIGQGWNQDLRDFTDQLGDIQDQLDKLNGPITNAPKPTTPKPNTGPTSPNNVKGKPPKPIAKPKPKPPATKPKPKPKPIFEKVSAWTSKNTKWDSTLGGIAKHYKTSVKTLYKLNPQLHNKPLIHPNQKIRVK